MTMTIVRPTHQIVDFGPGPQDQTLGYTVEGTEEECERHAEELNASCPNLRMDGGDRFCIQEIPDDEEYGL